jgi:subtilisin family serine protease
VFATTQNQVLHGWNLVELENHAGNWGSPLSSNRLEGYTNGDPYYGIGEPSCARSCITVAAHNPDRGADRTGPIAPFSSYGPIMGGTYTKPDISGPGMSIASSMNSFTTEEYSPVKTMRFKGRMYSFAKLSGTSMSSPAVAGVVALMLHANPRLTPSQVRDIIIETARIDDKTGDLSDSVSVRWGYGKVDAVAAIEKALEYVSIDNIVETKNVVVYPNPANSRININYNGDEPISVYLYGIDGKCLIQKRNVRELDVQRIPVGIYLLKIKTAEDVITKKIMIAK